MARVTLEAIPGERGIPPQAQWVQWMAEYTNSSTVPVVWRNDMKVWYRCTVCWKWSMDGRHEISKKHTTNANYFSKQTKDEQVALTIECLRDLARSEPSSIFQYGRLLLWGKEGTQTGTPENNPYLTRFFERTGLILDGLLHAGNVPIEAACLQVQRKVFAASVGSPNPPPALPPMLLPLSPIQTQVQAGALARTPRGLQDGGGSDAELQPAGWASQASGSRGPGSLVAVSRTDSGECRDSVVRVVHFGPPTIHVIEPQAEHVRGRHPDRVKTDEVLEEC